MHVFNCKITNSAAYRRERVTSCQNFDSMLAQIVSAASFSLRECRVPSKVHFTAKHLTVFGLFRIALSKRRGEKKQITETTLETPRARWA